MREWCGLTDLYAGIESKTYISDGNDIYVRRYGEDGFTKLFGGSSYEKTANIDLQNNCNYCDQPLRLDNNNRCICCGAQK